MDKKATRLILLPSYPLKEFQIDPKPHNLNLNLLMNLISINFHSVGRSGISEISLK